MEINKEIRRFILIFSMIEKNIKCIKKRDCNRKISIEVFKYLKLNHIKNNKLV